MPKDKEKEVYRHKKEFNAFLRRPHRETLKKDEELSKVEDLEDQIREAQIVVNGKNEIIRLPEIETVYYHSSNDKNVEAGTEESGQENNSVEGRRIVELTELGKRLWCGTCKEALSLSFIEKECRRGLGSLLLIRCHKCLVINEVGTGKMHDVNTDRRTQRFDINTDLPLCVLNTGVTLGLVNKVFSYFKIPSVHQKTYKKFEEEIGDEEIAAIKARRSKHGYALDED